MKVLLFNNTCEHTKQLCDYLNQNNISCYYMDANTSMKDRQTILYNFEIGYIRCLSVVNILNEGIYIPIADTCIFAESRSSKIGIIQCIGRVLRLHVMKKFGHVVILGNNMDINEIISIIANNDKEIKDSIVRDNNSRITYMKEKKKVGESDEGTGEIEIEDINLFDSYGNIIRCDWEYKYDMIKQFFEINNRMPKNKEEFMNLKIGIWYDNQKVNYRKKELSLDRINKLELLNKCIWNSGKSKLIWEQNYNILIEFYGINNRLPKKREKYNNINIGYWYATQVKKYKKNGFKIKEYINKLEILNKGIWGNKSHKILWNTNYNILVEFYKINNRLPKQNKIYENAKIGRWYTDQKSNRNSLNKEQKNKLSIFDLIFLENIIISKEYILNIMLVKELAGLLRKYNIPGRNNLRKNNMNDFKLLLIQKL